MWFTFDQIWTNMNRNSIHCKFTSSFLPMKILLFFRPGLVLVDLKFTCCYWLQHNYLKYLTLLLFALKPILLVWLKRYGNTTPRFRFVNVTETQNYEPLLFCTFPVIGNVTETLGYMFPLCLRIAETRNFALRHIAGFFLRTVIGGD